MRSRDIGTTFVVRKDPCGCIHLFVGVIITKVPPILLLPEHPFLDLKTMPIALRLTTFVAGFAAHDVVPGQALLIYLLLA